MLLLVTIRPLTFCSSCNKLYIELFIKFFINFIRKLSSAVCKEFSRLPKVIFQEFQIFYSYISKILSVVTFFSLVIFILTAENHVKRSSKCMNQISLSILTKFIAAVYIEVTSHIGNPTVPQGLAILYLMQISQLYHLQHRSSISYQS